MYDRILKGGTCVLPQGTMLADVAIKDEKIVQIGDGSAWEAKQITDVTGKHVLPGLIDSQVHFREPGLEHKEDFANGSAGAALGGITAFFEMPNTNPPTLTRAALENKLDRANGRSWTNYAFFMGASPENVDKLEDLEKTAPGCAGVKIFMGSSTGNLLLEEEEMVRQALQNGSRRVCVHAEDEERLRARKHIAEKAAHPRAHPEWRDEETAFLATQKVVRLARETGRRVHVLHITTKREIEFLAQNKDAVTVECLPQHLTLCAPECYEELGSLAQMNPPIRTKEHQDALWWGIEQGVVDVLGSDHAPHTLEEKAKTYPNSPSGMTGTQTMVPLMLDHVNAGRLTLERLVDLLCYGPARVFSIKGKGRLAVGYDADITVVDMTRQETIRNRHIASTSGWTPFEGKTVTGWPIMTILAGETVMENGELIGVPKGRAVSFAF